MKTVLSPSIYVGHGAPTTAITEGKYQTSLSKFAKQKVEPTSIVVVSAHWESHIPMFVTSSDLPGVIYDFGGFPQVLYELEYNSPGNPKLASQVSGMLNSAGWKTQLNSVRGLDHGAWIPLRIMYPNATIPVIQLSIPIPRTPLEFYKIGQVLAPLREENIMLMGSGNLVHNIPHAIRQMQAGKVDTGFNNPAEEWAKETDEWLKEKIDNYAIDDLLDSPNKAPHFRMAAPTTEHFDPLYFILGTQNKREGIYHFYEGFQAGSFSMRCFANED